MEQDEKQDLNEEANLFVLHGDKITAAYQRAVREAVLKHKKLDQYVVTSRDGKALVLQPDEIDFQ